jgi:NAD(P)-dependent dehydrogenase (short-subunit alcohol dehydrogenase family)
MGEPRVALVVGAGPGLGAAVARRFARGGFDLGLVSRREETTRPLAAELERAGGRALAIAADATDARSIAAGFERLRRVLGDPEVLVYNAGAFVPGTVAEVSVAQFESAWRANCLGGFVAVKEALPAMVARGRGTILFTGATASYQGAAGYSCLVVGKWGLKGLALSLAREVGRLGVHVAHVAIDGQIGTPGARADEPGRAAETFLAPEAIAETYWQIHVQDRTAWALDVDLRPAVEEF